jgi:hypothetical protein
VGVISLFAQQPFEPFDGFFDVRTYSLNGSNGFNFEAYFDTIWLLWWLMYMKYTNWSF